MSEMTATQSWTILFLLFVVAMIPIRLVVSFRLLDRLLVIAVDVFHSSFG